MFGGEGLREGRGGAAGGVALTKAARICRRVGKVGMGIGIVIGSHDDAWPFFRIRRACMFVVREATIVTVVTSVNAPATREKVLLPG